MGLRSIDLMPARGMLGIRKRPVNMVIISSLEKNGLPRSKKFIHAKVESKHYLSVNSWAE